MFKQQVSQLQGLSIDFPNYEVDELFEISQAMSRDPDYVMTDEAGAVRTTHIEREKRPPAPLRRGRVRRRVPARVYLRPRRLVHFFVGCRGGRLRRALRLGSGRG